MGAEPIFFNDNVTGDAMVERLVFFEIAVAIRERTPFRRALLDRLPNLRKIAATGMRNLGIDVAACRERGIVAEDRSLRAGTRQTRRIGHVVKARTLGLVGLGKLGSEGAGMGRAFGMDVMAWSPNLTASRAGAQRCAAGEQSGFVRPFGLHQPAHGSRRTIVRDRRCHRDRCDATGDVPRQQSRAGLVDQAALVAALNAGRIGDAGLDVFDTEPIPRGAPILQAPNTILTPHPGYATQENYGTYFPQVVENLAAFLDGSPRRVLTHD